MKIYRVLGVILVALCFFACNSNKENEYEYQPLTIDNYAEVSLGDTTNLIITGGSGNIVVEGNDKVDISTDQNDKQKITLIGKEIGTTNIFVRDKITNESCSIEVNVIFPFLNFEEEGGKNFHIKPNSLFVLVASEDSICYVFSYNNMQFKYNDIPMMKGTYHISQNGTMLSFDLKGENSTFEHTFKVKNDNVAYLLSNMSSISTLPKTYLTASFTDVETGTDFPHVFIGNKFLKNLPKRE